VPTVLVLDEDTDSRLLLKRLLELGGHSVVTCSDQALALGAARSENPDLVIIHVQAGSRWGPGLPALLKAENERLKIMTIADYVSDQISDAAMGDDFLSKPVDLETIERKVRELLARSNTGISLG
jgi:DNA-binding response OmpR family regulator